MSAESDLRALLARVELIPKDHVDAYEDWCFDAGHSLEETAASWLALIDAAQRVGDADNQTLGEFPHTQRGENALREMTDALEELAAAVAALTEPRP